MRLDRNGIGLRYNSEIGPQAGNFIAINRAWAFAVKGARKIPYDPKSGNRFPIKVVLKRKQGYFSRKLAF